MSLSLHLHGVPTFGHIRYFKPKVLDAIRVLEIRNVPTSSNHTVLCYHFTQMLGSLLHCPFLGVLCLTDKPGGVGDAQGVDQQTKDMFVREARRWIETSDDLGHLSTIHIRDYTELSSGPLILEESLGVKVVPRRVAEPEQYSYVWDKWSNTLYYISKALLGSS